MMKHTRLLLPVLFALTLSACEVKIIDRVKTLVSQDLQRVRVSLLFTPGIQSSFSGGIAIKEYGMLFVNPWTPTTPFEVGFDLDTAIVNEQDYLHLQPTTVLPNGYPLGTPGTVVEIRQPEPVSPDFDLYAYVDVLGKSWLGGATMMKKMTEAFPQGLVVSQVFLRDASGGPAVIGHAYGPVWNQNGTLRSAGGVAVVANARFLVEQARGSGPGRAGRSRTLYPAQTKIVRGVGR